MATKRPWIVASATAFALAGLGTGYAVATDGAVHSDQTGQVQLTGDDADSANSPAGSANSPAGSANSPVGQARTAGAGDSADSPAQARPAAPVRTHVSVTG